MRRCVQVSLMIIITAIKKLPMKYKNQIAIRIGLECEYFPEYMGWLKTLLVNYDMDYIIFGNHYYKTDENVFILELLVRMTPI